ncbi:MAG: ornithine cyclodeaminase family protein, partial [Alphaproteobacteria bacterium]
AADVVITTTPSKQPIVKAEWLHPGLHITAVGADLADKQELEAAVLARAHLVVCDRRAQCARMGELHHALAAGAVRDEGAVAELGELVLGRAPGRRSNDEITVCDLTGTGVQDSAIAALAYERARANGVGLTVKN